MSLRHHQTSLLTVGIHKTISSMRKTLSPLWSSLLSISVDNVVNNLPLYSCGNFEVLVLLPSHLKNRILKRFTTSLSSRKNVDLTSVLHALLNRETRHVHLSCVTLNDDILAALENGTNIKSLYLYGSAEHFVTNRALLSLFSRLHNLTDLVLKNCNEVNDDVLKCLAENCPRLIALDVGGCKSITDIGMEALSKLGNLSCLTMSNTLITDDGIMVLVKGGAGWKIKELAIENCPTITEVGVKAIADCCPNIEILRLFNKDRGYNRNIVNFHDVNFKHLKQLTWTVKW